MVGLSREKEREREGKREMEGGGVSKWEINIICMWTFFKQMNSPLQSLLFFKLVLLIRKITKA